MGQSDTAVKLHMGQSDTGVKLHLEQSDTAVKLGTYHIKYVGGPVKPAASASVLLFWSSQTPPLPKTHPPTHTEEEHLSFEVFPHVLNANDVGLIASIALQKRAVILGEYL